MIPKKIRDEILSSFEVDRNYYRTQIYGYITPRKNGEFTLNCYAVNIAHSHGIRMTEVNRAWSDRPYYVCKDLWKSFFGGTRVCFDERYRLSFQEGMWYNGKWGQHIKVSDESWFLPYVRYMNLDALSQTKYRYCSYERYHGQMSLMNYVRLFSKHKEVEFLAKAGLFRFIDEKFLDKMANKKELRDFFRSKTKELMENQDYDRIHVIRALANGWTLKKAYDEECIRRSYKMMPKGIDRHILHKYLKDNDISKWDYFHYCEFVAEAHRDILGFGVTFPKDFHKAVVKMQKEIKREKEELEFQKQERMKKIAARINKLLDGMKLKLEMKIREYKVVIPMTRDDFEIEGRAMNNCIGGYFTRCADGDTACFFIRKGGRRLADVEMSPKTGKVLQCRARFNRECDEETKEFAAVVAKKILPAVRKKKLKTQHSNL